MEDGASQLIRFESVVERTRSEDVGIEFLQLLACAFVLRHEAELDERAHEIVSTLQVAVSATTLPARSTALDRIRRFTLAVAPIRKVANPHSQYPAGFVVIIQFDRGPADGVGAYIQTEPVMHIVRRRHICSPPIDYRFDQWYTLPSGGSQYGIIPDGRLGGVLR